MDPSLGSTRRMRAGGVAVALAALLTVLLPADAAQAATTTTVHGTVRSGSSTCTIRAGRTTDGGTIALHLHAPLPGGRRS